MKVTQKIYVSDEKRTESIRIHRIKQIGKQIMEQILRFTDGHCVFVLFFIIQSRNLYCINCLCLSNVIKYHLPIA